MTEVQDDGLTPRQRRAAKAKEAQPAKTTSQPAAILAGLVGWRRKQNEKDTTHANIDHIGKLTAVADQFERRIKVTEKRLEATKAQAKALMRAQRPREADALTPRISDMMAHVSALNKKLRAVERQIGLHENVKMTNDYVAAMAASTKELNNQHDFLGEDGRTDFVSDVATLHADDRLNDDALIPEGIDDEGEKSDIMEMLMLEMADEDDARVADEQERLARARPGIGVADMPTVPTAAPQRLRQAQEYTVADAIRGVPYAQADVCGMDPPVPSRRGVTLDDNDDAASSVASGGVRRVRKKKAGFGATPMRGLQPTATRGKAPATTPAPTAEELELQALEASMGAM